MRPLLPLILLSLLVVIQTPVGQLFKVPVLIQHFIKHQQQNGVSVMGFLEEHYSSAHHDADLPEDEQLPFKSITLFIIGVAIMPGLIRTNVVAVLTASKKIIIPYTYSTQQHLGSIFHPPRW